MADIDLSYKWVNLELASPSLSTAQDTEEMSKFAGAITDKLQDVWSYISPHSIWDADRDTGVDVEESPDEDIIHFYAGGVHVMTADNDQMAVLSDIKLGLEGSTGDTYLKYNSATTYMEFYVDGGLRLQM